MSELNDSWQTPQWLFDELDKEFNFDIDLCANAENSKCDRFYSDYLTNRIHRKGDHSGDATGYYWSLEGHNNPLSCDKIHCAFMNPPYSRPTKTNPGINAFIEKAWEDSKHCKIVCLVKCDPSTKWWATFWNYEPVKKLHDQYEIYTIENRGPKSGCEVRFLPKRIRFEAPPGLDGQSGPTFPSCIVIMDRRNIL